MKRERRRPRFWIVTAVTLAIGIGVLAGWTGENLDAGTASRTAPSESDDGAPERGADPAPAAPPSGAEVAELSASEMLDSLQVKGRAPKTGYDRGELFGKGWKDPDRNGCDARNDVLARDLGDAVTQGGCKVMSGTLDDPYTGKRIDFVRGDRTSSLVQIDHVVALSDAWQKGARALTPEERLTFANDPLNLLAVDGATNSAKGDGDAATWLPPERGFRCEYVARQISAKAAYRLWVTDAEHRAMTQVLSSCPGQPAYSS